MYHYSKKKSLNYLQYILWVLAEILSMAIVYSIMVKFILVDERDFMDILRVSLKNTSLVLLLPYTILWLFFSYYDKTVQLQNLENRGDDHPKSSMLIPFHDSKGTMRLTIQKEDLFYLEAADNYVTIHYLRNQKPARFMIRNSMKVYEQQFLGSNIIRCHRSYMVNLDKVRIIRKESDGLHLELAMDSSIDLPVSKTYIKSVLEAFSTHSTVDI
jgi:DNA-binding LytR/AlgR family response regulator